jgi:hypothetical protein
MTALRLPMLALAAATGLPAQDPFAIAVQKALELSRPALLDHLAAQARGDRPRQEACGELALLALAALHDGVPADDRVLAPALGKLAAAKPLTTYELSLRLLVLEAHPGFPHRDAIARGDAAELLRHCDAGGFHYLAGGGWDLSNSQYGALGLRAAKALGAAVPDAAWRRLLQTVADAQLYTGGFGYQDGPPATLSMTAAGIAVLLICEQALAAPGTRLPEVERAVARAWAWVGRNTNDIGDKRLLWCHYALYGLERAAILGDVDKVGGVDWYRRGAEKLLAEQQKRGGWRASRDFAGGRLDDGRGDAVSTAFAVLFLCRRFQKVPGAITPRAVMFAQIDDATPPADVEASVRAQVARGVAGFLVVIEHLLSDVPSRRRAAAAAAQQIAGDTFGYDPALDAAANREAVHRAELWYLQHR